MEREESVERRFVVDSMLGKLAKWLRVLGFDTRYERFRRQEQLDDYRKDGLLPITRNQRWCKQTQVIRLAANDSMGQLRELISLLQISRNEVRPLQRCLLCNQRLELLPREKAFGSVPDYVFETNTIFHLCPACHRIFWPGSHSERMLERIHSALGWHY
ncbi:MAG: Mut7-C RNAse domain-containing protein [Syntrophobacteraceae bacterium]